MGQRYEIIDLIAMGGMAEIYRARSLGARGFEKTVVVKKILPHMTSEPACVELLVEEAKVAASLQHGNIVQVYDLGLSEGGDLFIVMEYVHGRDLARVLGECTHRGLVLPMEEVLYIGRQVCRGLDFAHRKSTADGRPLGLVHRDISPENLMLSFDGEVKITDFGIAKAASRLDETQAGYLKGKYGYMSPEQAGFKPMDHRSDIYNVGIVLFELATGEHLFAGSSKQSILRDMRDPAAAIAVACGSRSIPADLEAILARALAVDPSNRFQSASEIELELIRFAAKSGLLATARDLSERMGLLFGDATLSSDADAETRLVVLGEVSEDRSSAMTDPEERPLPMLWPRGAERQKADEDEASLQQRSRVPTEDIPPPGSNSQPERTASSRTGVACNPRTGVASSSLPAPTVSPRTNVTSCDRRSSSEKAASPSPPSPLAVRGRRPLASLVATAGFTALGLCTFLIAFWLFYPSREVTNAAQSPRFAPSDVVDVEATFVAPRRLLLVESEPPGAAISVEGRLIEGVTPWAIALEEDNADLEIALEAQGYLPWRERVSFSSNVRAHEIQARLIPRTGRVRLRSLPSGAEIFIDGEPRGKAPAIIDDVAYGRRLLRLFAPDHVIWERELEVSRPNHRLNVRLVPKAQAGFLELLTWPDLESLSIGGVYVPLDRAEARLALAAGLHNLRLRSTEGGERELTVRVEPGRTSRLFVSILGE